LRPYILLRSLHPKWHCTAPVRNCSRLPDHGCLRI